MMARMRALDCTSMPSRKEVEKEALRMARSSAALTASRVLSATNACSVAVDLGQSCGQGRGMNGGFRSCIWLEEGAGTMHADQADTIW